MVLTMNVRGEQVDFPLISDILFNIYNEVTVITTLLDVGIPVHQVQALVAKIQVPDSRLNQVSAGGVTVVQAMSKGRSEEHTSELQSRI